MVDVVSYCKDACHLQIALPQKKSRSSLAPKTSVGKLDKTALRQQYVDSHAATEL